MIRDLAKSCLEVFACLQVTTTVTTVNMGLAYLLCTLPLTWSTSIFVSYLGWYIYDRKTPFLGGRHSSFLRNFFLWRYVASYFPIKLHKTADLDPSKNYIFAFHPHGFFAYGALTNFCTNATGFDEMFPGLCIHFIVLNGQFKFPFYRDYLISFGFGSANPESIDYKLSKLGPGHSVWIAVGGYPEMLFFDQSCYTLKINSRKGFIRKALKNGALVVPVFSFNEHRLYDMSFAKKWSAGYFIQQAFKFITSLELPANIRGRWWWAGYTVPKNVPINTVIGAPIDFCELNSFNKGEEPPEELVDKCHQFYLEALRRLYEDNKARFGDENTPLIFI